MSTPPRPIGRVTATIAVFRVVVEIDPVFPLPDHADAPVLIAIGEEQEPLGRWAEGLEGDLQG